jgi:hypothetical protein
MFIAAFQIGSGVVLGIVASAFAEAGPGLAAYRDRILSVVGVAALALVISLAGAASFRRSVVGKPMA